MTRCLKCGKRKNNLNFDWCRACRDTYVAKPREYMRKDRDLAYCQNKECATRLKQHKRDRMVQVDKLLLCKKCYERQTR